MISTLSAWDNDTLHIISTKDKSLYKHSVFQMGRLNPKCQNSDQPPCLWHDSTGFVFYPHPDPFFILCGSILLRHRVQCQTVSSTKHVKYAVMLLLCHFGSEKKNLSFLFIFLLSDYDDVISVPKTEGQTVWHSQPQILLRKWNLLLKVNPWYIFRDFYYFFNYMA